MKYKNWTQVTPENQIKADELRKVGFLKHSCKNKTNSKGETISEEHVKLNPQGNYRKKREEIEQSKGLTKLINRIINLPA